MFKRRPLPPFSQTYRMLFAFSGFVLVLSIALGYGIWTVDPVLAKKAIEEIIKEEFMAIIEK